MDPAVHLFSYMFPVPECSTPSHLFSSKGVTAESIMYRVKLRHTGNTASLGGR